VGFAVWTKDLQARQPDSLAVLHYAQARVEHLEQASGVLHSTVDFAPSTKEWKTQQPDFLAVL
jgi:hypothetical protein